MAKHIREFWARANFQLPLSGSLIDPVVCVVEVVPKVFQLPLSGSLLSRRPRRRLNPLSTPSLGITLGGDVFTNLVDDVRVNIEEAFNSLSRDHLFAPCAEQLNFLVGLSTPSLGITPYSQTALPSLARLLHFQLPLSGKLNPIRIRSKNPCNILSTPSLGITEPDSGIFRLSAAFCRGTSSHK